MRKGVCVGVLVGVALGRGVAEGLSVAANVSVGGSVALATTEELQPARLSGTGNTVLLMLCKAGSLL